MPDCERKYIITMCEDVGFGSVLRDRGWLTGVRAPWRWIGDPNRIYTSTSAPFCQKSKFLNLNLWWEDADGLQRKRRKMAGRFRKALCLGLMKSMAIFFSRRRPVLFRSFFGVTGCQFVTHLFFSRSFFLWWNFIRYPNMISQRTIFGSRDPADSRTSVILKRLVRSVCFFLFTLPKFSSSPLKSCRDPIGKDRLPTIHFSGASC